MNELMQDPGIQAAVLPFIVAFVLVAVIRLGGGADWGARFATLALCAAILVAYWLLEGLPPFPPVASKQKLFYLALLAIALGLILDAGVAGRTAIKSAAAFYPLVAVLWLGQPKIMNSLSVELVLLLLFLWVGAVVSLWLLEYATQTGHLRVNEAAAKGGLNAPTLLMLAAFASAIISFLGAFIGLAQISVAIGASLAAYMVLNYLIFVVTGRSLYFGAMGVVGIGGTWIAGVYVMALFGGKVNTVALAILVVVFIADLFARRLRVGGGVGARVIEPIVYGVVVAIPALVAAVVAYLSYAPQSGY